VAPSAGIRWGLVGFDPTNQTMS